MEKEVKYFVFLVIMLDLSGLGDTQLEATFNGDLFQCQPSSEQLGQVFTPSIPDFFFNQPNAATLRSNGTANLTRLENRFTYIFPVPPLSVKRNCSGLVLGIEYCYKAERNSTGELFNTFNFVIFNQNTTHLSVENRVRVRSRPRDNICTALAGLKDQDMICCDKFAVPRRRMLLIPSSSFMFGVLIREGQLLTLTDHTSIEQHQVLFGNAGSIGTTVAVSELEEASNQPILLLRIAIEPEDIDLELTTEQVAVLSSTLSDESPSPTHTTDTSTPNQLSMSMITAIFAGAVAAGSLLIVIITVTIAAILATRLRAAKRRRRKKRKHCKQPTTGLKTSQQHNLQLAGSVASIHNIKMMSAEESAYATPPSVPVYAMASDSSTAGTEYATPPSSFYATPPSSFEETVHTM